MVHVENPLVVLQLTLEDAAVRLPRDLRVPAADAHVYAMFYQPSLASSSGHSHEYCTVLWVESKVGWLVYFDGQYAYRVLTSEMGEVAAFLRDLRTNRLEQGVPALARYRAKK